MPRAITPLLKLATGYLGHWLRAVNAHGLHSPFMFPLYNQVVDDSTHYYAFDDIEAFRKKLLSSKKTLLLDDFGAGTQGVRAQRRTLAALARRSSVRPKTGRMLFRLANYLQPATLLELGTCLGLGTLYLKSGCKSAAMSTLEGSPALAAEAKAHFTGFGLDIAVVQGEISQTLPGVLAGYTPPGIVFFDANHRYAPTVAYFESCLPHIGEDCVFVFDDIRWSGEMLAAWNYVKAHPAVTLTADLYSCGLVFFRKKQPKQHFLLRF